MEDESRQPEHTNAEDDEESQKRGSKWERDDTYYLVSLVAKEGKNWSKILQCAHDAHRLTHITEPSKLRTHYTTSTGKSGCLCKPYKRPKFSPSKKGLTKDEIMKEETEFGLQQERLSNDHAAAIANVSVVNKREKKLASDGSKNEAELKAAMKEKAEERREVREDRLKLVTEEANAEKDHRTESRNLLKRIADQIEKESQMETLLCTYLQLAIAEKKMRLQQ